LKRSSQIELDEELDENRLEIQMPIDYAMEYINKSFWVNNFFLLDEKGLTFCWIRGLFLLTGDQT
jgi:hypothetical protein